MLKHINKRFSSIFLLCLISLIVAYYAQYALGKEPCPLCIAERVIVAFIGIFSLIFTIHSPKNVFNKIYSLIIAILSILGIQLSHHHIWLMNLPPDQQPLSCGMPLAILFEKVSVYKFLHTILRGDAECSIINWRILGLTGPQAVLILCLVILAISIFNYFRKS